MEQVNIQVSETVEQVSIHVNEGLYALKSELPSSLAQLTGDETHRVVTDSEIAAWNMSAGEMPDLSAYALIGDIPVALSELSGDSTHRLVSDTEKSTWDAKQPAGSYLVADDIANKVDKVTGKGLSTNDYTTAEQTKLSGIATNANNYTHPANHSPAIITQDSGNRFVSDAEKAIWNAKQPALTTDPDTIASDTSEITGFLLENSWNFAVVAIAATTKLSITISTIGSHIVYYWRGVKVTVISPLVVISTEDKNEGIWYCYSTNGTDFLLTQTPWIIYGLVSGVIRRDLSVFSFYWDHRNHQAIFIQPEFHGCIMDADSHAYLHKSIGTKYNTGLVLSSGLYQSSGNGDKRVKLTSGTISDEDILATISHNDDPFFLWEQVLGSAGSEDPNYAHLPIYYRSDSDGDLIWRKQAASSYPFYPATDNVALNYNRLNGGTWDFATAVPDGYYCNMYIVATLNQSEPVIIVPGRVVSKLFTEVTNEKFPDLFIEGLCTEFKLIYTLVYRVANNTAGKASLESVTDQRASSGNNLPRANIISDYNPASFFTMIGSLVADQVITCAYVSPTQALNFTPVFPALSKALTFSVYESNCPDSTFSSLTVLTKIVATFAINGCINLTSVSLASVTFASSPIVITKCKNLASLNVSNIISVQGNINLSQLPRLSTINFAELLYIFNTTAALTIDGSYVGETTTVLGQVLFPKLIAVSSGISVNNTICTSITFPALQSVSGLLTFTGNPSLTSLTFPVLRTCAGLTVSTSPSLTNIQLGNADGTGLIEVYGNVSIATTGNLTQDCINLLAMSLAYLDGQNGTSKFTGRTISLKTTNRLATGPGTDHYKLVTTLGNTITYT